MKQEIGALLHLYLDEIQAGEPTEVHDFLIQGAAKTINETDGRNWIPLIVKQTGFEEYQVIANSFVLAVAQAAGLNKVWCIVADDSENTQRSAQMLAQEIVSKINLVTATRDEIKVGLDYLIRRSTNPLVGVKLAIATERINSAARETWKESLMDVTKLKCGITTGSKLNIFKEVFYVMPMKKVVSVEAEKPSTVISPSNTSADSQKKSLDKLTVAELKTLAKERGITGYTKMKKADLLGVLSQA